MLCLVNRPVLIRGRAARYYAKHLYSPFFIARPVSDYWSRASQTSHHKDIQTIMSPVAIPSSPVTQGGGKWEGTPSGPSLVRLDATSPSTTTDLLVSTIEQDGGVIIENLITAEAANKIRSELKPYFNTDVGDKSGFFPSTTDRATGLLGRSAACVELAMNKTFIDVANKMISSTYTYWNGQVQETVTSKPIISSTVGFRVRPGGRQQALHRDDSYVSRE